MLRIVVCAVAFASCVKQPTQPAEKPAQSATEAAKVEDSAAVMRATWKGVVLAESDATVVVEDNHYFPPESVKMDLLKLTDKTYECSWKGHAKYYDIAVEGQTNPSAAWVYPEPEDAAANIKGRVAFWKGVEVTEARQSSP